MDKTLRKLADELEQDIKDAYAETPTVEEAEKLAGKFLAAQMRVANELAMASLDARMKKSGLKTIKATVYMDSVSGADKKPTEGMLTAIIDSDESVNEHQDLFDKAEVEVEQLYHYMSIFKEGHVYFRQLSKGGFNG